MENNNIASTHLASGRKPQPFFKEMLPLHCPTKEVELWNAHPLVYLDIAETGTACCPYCGTQFVLQD